MTDDQMPTGDGQLDEFPDDQFVASVTVTRDQAAELIGRGEYDFGDHPTINPIDDDTARLTLFLSRRQSDDLRGEGFAIELGLNMSALGRERASEVGVGDRYEGGSVVPRGIGRKVGGRGERDVKEERS